jgi:hypothetical protein
MKDLEEHPPPAGHPGMPAYVRAALAEAARVELLPLGRARSRHDPRTPLLVAVLRNEAAVVGELLAHYRGLGVTRFALIDNGSDDATADLLAAEPDVDLYSVRRPFPGKQGWVNALIARYGYDRWYLHVDADEHLVFDGAPAHGRPGRGLVELIGFAEARGLRRLRGMLVDMYAAGPLLAPPEGGGLAERFRLFDGAGYAEALCLGRISRKGGPRKRRFGFAGGGFDPELTKYPLFHIREGEVAAGPHVLYPYPDNYASDCFLALLHYKFGPGFFAKAERATAERNYWRGSLEYGRYLEALAEDPGLALAYPGSRAYAGPADLVAAGLIAPIAWDRRPSLRRGLARLRRWLRPPAAVRTDA